MTQQGALDVRAEGATQVFRGMSVSDLVGKVCVGKYPRHNYRHVPSDYEDRRVLVESVRDLRNQPLDPQTVVLNPFLVRTDTLIEGFDLDKGVERKFYLERFVELAVHMHGPQRLIGGMSQVISIDDRGDEEVLNPCVPDDGAEEFSKVFNLFSEHHGKRAVIRSVSLPCLAGNSCRKLG